MTDIQTLLSANEAPKPPTSAWDTQFARLRERFRGVKDTILFCVHAIQSGADADIDDLKAQAQLHGLRITGASLNAARRLILGGDARPATRTIAPSQAAPRRARQIEGRSQPMVAGALSQEESNKKLAAMRGAMEEALSIIDDVLQ